MVQKLLEQFNNNYFNLTNKKKIQKEESLQGGFLILLSNIQCHCKKGHLLYLRVQVINVNIVRKL